MAAGIFLVQEAEGKVSDFGGGDNYIHGREVIAANKGIFPEVFSQVNRAFNKDS